MATDPVPEKQVQREMLFEYLLGNQAAWVIDVGLKAGLFQAIADAGPSGIQEEALAERLGYFAPYVRVWCRAGFAFHLVEWDEATGYSLTPHMASLLLDSTDPQFMGGRIQFYTALHEDYRAFPESLRTGRVWPRSEHDPWLLDALKNLTKPDAIVLTDHVLPQAPATMARLEAGGTILELGPGGGYLLAHFAGRFPQCQVVGLEYDEPSVALARRTLTEAGVDARVAVRHGDANELEAENAYDLIVMNIVLHETGGPTEYHNVLVRCLRALTPGGTLLVSELPYPDSPADYRTNPVYQALAGVQIHEAQVGCGAITQGELRTLLVNAGFRHLRVADQPLATRFVMLAEK